MREEIGHLERRAGGLGAAVDARLRLLARLGRDHAERHRDARLDRRQLEAARRLARDEVEVRRLPADDAAERDDAREAAGLRERERRQRQLERPGDGHDRDGVVLDVAVAERLQRVLEQGRRDVAVEPADDDGRRCDGSRADRR